MRMNDVHFMERALQLAERGAGWVSPNPLVGCVVVRDGQVLGEGWHSRYGGPHAEVVALEDARAHSQDVRGATMYVTLEPCSHYGKTPPCVPVVAASGVTRVVAAVQDPHDVVNGRGLLLLRDAGIAVDVGVCAGEAREQNRIFLHWVRTGLPYVTVKVAVSADDLITAAAGTRTAISGPEALRFVHELRHRHDAILVGAGTVLIDNPELSVRGIKGARQPLRVILDADGRVPSTARVLRDDAVLVVRERLPLADVWHMLADRGVSSVLVEGGQQVLTQCLEEDAAQEWLLIRSSHVFGRGVSFVSDVATFHDRWALARTQQLSGDSVERYQHRPLAS